jgi:hypothetical protein
MLGKKEDISTMYDNFISTVEQSDKVFAKYRIKFYKIRKSCDLYGNPGADANKLQRVEQEQRMTHPM